MTDYEKMFDGREAPEPPAGLARAILVRIERRERHLLVAKIVATICVFGGSLVVLGVGFADFQTSLAQTGFLQFGSLIFSDFSLIVSNLPDFMFSMIESFPMFSAAAMLAGTGVAIWAVGAMFDEFSTVERHRFSFPSRVSA